MRMRILLGVWLLGLLFPVIMLRDVSASYRHTIDTLFGAEWVHIVLHLMLFGGLSALILVSLHMPPTRMNLLKVVAFSLVVGMLQELFQIMAQKVSAIDELAFRKAMFDLVIDSAGSLLGFGLVWLAWVWQRNH